MRYLILAALAGFVFAFGVTIATRAEALPSKESNTYYYSDDTFTTVVGYEYIGCDYGDRYLEGDETRWYKRSWSACYPSTGSGVGCYSCMPPVCDSTGCTGGTCGQVICP